MTAQVLQIVPELPPRLGGVGGYALALARALRDHAGMETHFLVTDPAWRPAETGETGVTGERLPARSVRALRGALTAAGREGLPVLLHYANYAYQRRGCPFWLVRTLEIRPSHRLVTFFHEVHAGGPPWRSSFWLAPLQRHLAARLARRSDRCATSLPLYRGLLEALAPGTDAVVLPVLSPLGEPAEVAPLAAPVSQHEDIKVQAQFTPAPSTQAGCHRGSVFGRRRQRRRRRGGASAHACLRGWGERSVRPWRSLLRG